MYHLCKCMVSCCCQPHSCSSSMYKYLAAACRQPCHAGPAAALPAACTVPAQHTCSAARCSAVRPSLVMLLRPAPRRSSRRHAATRPVSAALCSAVQPPLLPASTAEPLSISISIICAQHKPCSAYRLGMGHIDDDHSRAAAKGSHAGVCRMFS
jgi:hypothetical protein